MTLTPPDIRLIAVDLDGTLLDAAGEIPPATWDVIDQLRTQGVMFAPASGRQYAKLLQMFDSHSESMIFVAENGTYVVRDGVELSSSPLSAQVLRQIVEHARELAEPLGVQVVLCGKRSAYIEWTDEVFLAEEVAPFFSIIEQVDDVLAVDDDILKASIFSPGHSESVLAPEFAHLADSLKVVVTAPHWVDIMLLDANKGTALRQVQAKFGITPAQTMVFGDFPNDIEMMAAAEWSYAMANAHPDVKRAAKFSAPANTEQGVLKVLTEVFCLD